jgi:hypothetical protein
MRTSASHCAGSNGKVFGWRGPTFGVLGSSQPRPAVLIERCTPRTSVFAGGQRSGVPCSRLLVARVASTRTVRLIAYPDPWCTQRRAARRRLAEAGSHAVHALSRGLALADNSFSGGDAQKCSNTRRRSRGPRWGATVVRPLWSSEEAPRLGRNGRAIRVLLRAAGITIASLQPTALTACASPGEGTAWRACNVSRRCRREDGSR